MNSDCESSDLQCLYTSTPSMRSRYSRQQNVALALDTDCLLQIPVTSSLRVSVSS